MESVTTIIQSLSDFWFQAVFTAMVLFLGYKYFDKKLFWKKFIEKARQMNRELDEKENEESKRMIRRIQSYLNDNSQRLNMLWIDRASVWINHNGMRNGKIHFIFYSLIAEYCAYGLSKFADTPVGSQKLPYYIFAEYEEMILQKNWIVFVSDQVALSQTSKAIAHDQWTQSLVIAPVFNMDWKIEWMIFFSSVYSKLQAQPEVSDMVSNIRALFIS